MPQVQTTSLIKDVFHSVFTWRIERFKEIIEEGFMTNGNILKTDKIMIVGIPVSWQLSCELIGNDKIILAEFAVIFTKTSPIDNYETLNYSFKIATNDCSSLNVNCFSGSLYNMITFANFKWKVNNKLMMIKNSIVCMPETKRAKLRQLLLPLSSDGNLEIACNVSIIGRKIGKVVNGTLDDKILRDCLKILSKDFSELLTDGDFSDVTFVAEDRELKVHKLILMARSQVFRTMLSVDMKEKNENRVNIPNVSFEAVKEFLKFIYSAKANVSAHARDIFILAEMYEINDLKEICEAKLLAQVNKENALDTLFLTNLHNCKHELKVKAFEVIVNEILGPLYNISTDLMNKPELVEVMVNAKLNCDDVHNEVQNPNAILATASKRQNNQYVQLET